MKNLQAFIFGLFTILIVGGATNAATWTVTKSTNSNDGTCNADCSLREAVFVADSGDTIVFNSNLVGQTFTLGGSEIVITRRITIDGFLNNPNVVFLSGEMTSRIFLIETGGGLNLRNITLVQGNGASNNLLDDHGGAICASINTSLSLNRVTLRANKAKFGGAIYLTFSTTSHITNSSLTGNSSESGAAIILIDNGSLSMSNTTVSGNSLYNNDPELGYGAITVRGSTVTIRNSTIVNNSARVGGGITLLPPTSISTTLLNIGNSIVAGNTATTGKGPDIYYFINDVFLTSAGGNLIQNLDTIPDGTFNQPNDISGVNPLLAPLNTNLDGFPVLSHPLQAGSPARNGGINANAVDPLTNQLLTFDTRGVGFPRIADGTVDIGAFEDQSGNTSLVVTKKTNSNDLVCDIDCSLREAVHQASLNFGTDTITFAPNVFGTLTLGGTEILIQNQNVNIVGYTKASILTISGGDTNRIFNLNNSTVSISGMTLTDGKAAMPNGLGGAIYGSSSNLTLDRVMIAGNQADAFPAFYMTGGSTQRVKNSTISANSAESCVAIGLKTTTLFMSNTTVSGNFDSNGGSGLGAICSSNDSFITIRNSTITLNRSQTGGGIFMNDTTLNIGNSIVAQNLAPNFPDIAVGVGCTVTSVGGNLIGSSDFGIAPPFNQTNDQIGTDALLAALADNGGNVTTHLLMPGSPAINTGINLGAIDPFDNSALLTDARGTGFSRIQGGTVDKGAFELQNIIAETGLEADVASRPDGDDSILSNDVVQIRRFLNASDTPNPQTNEFQRADSAPYNTKGDGKILSNDVVQARRYLNASDASQTAGGPIEPDGGKPMADGLEFGKQSAVAASERLARELRIESATASAGQPVTINIRVDAQGDEAEYGFLLNYDSSVLSNPIIGAGAAGATVRSCNTSIAGQLNCSVGGFPNNNPASSDSGIGEIGAGNNQILITLTFTAAPNMQLGTTTPLALSNVNASSDAPQLFMPTATNGMVTILALTAANVTVGGRVMTSDGNAVSRTQITLTDSSGETRTARTNSFGYYRFETVEAGQTYIVNVFSKQYRFKPQVVTIMEETSELNFTAQ